MGPCTPCTEGGLLVAVVVRGIQPCSVAQGGHGGPLPLSTEAAGLPV